MSCYLKREIYFLPPFIPRIGVESFFLLPRFIAMRIISFVGLFLVVLLVVLLFLFRHFRHDGFSQNKKRRNPVKGFGACRFPMRFRNYSSPYASIH